MVDYQAALKRSFLDFRLFLIGLLVSILPIVNWIAKGYFLEVSGLTKNKVKLDKLPSWGNYGDLFIKGFFMTLIRVIYFLPAIVLLFIGASSVIIGFFRIVFRNMAQVGTGPMLGDAISNEISILMPDLMVALPFIVIAIILGFIALYIFPICILNYAKNNNFSDAFNFRLIFSKVLRGKYLGVWLFASLISFMLSLLLNWIPIIGPAIVFYISGVISYSLFGQVFKEV